MMKPTFNSYTDVYLSLGGNIGDVEKTMFHAFQAIKGIPQTAHFRCSALYRTSPVSPIPQDDFLNCVCHIKTGLSPTALLLHLQKIEDRLGKKPKPRYAPRYIDIDIIFYGQKAINLPRFKVPHPEWRNRLFVLRPLADLTPAVLTPPSCKAENKELFVLKELIDAIPDREEQQVSSI